MLFIILNICRRGYPSKSYLEVESDYWPVLGNPQLVGWWTIHLKMEELSWDSYRNAVPISSSILRKKNKRVARPNLNLKDKYLLFSGIDDISGNTILSVRR